MATPSEVAAYRQSQAEVAALALAELNAWWETVNTIDLRALARALEKFLPTLVATFGDISATVASDWYADLRDRSGAPGIYSPVLGDVIPEEQAKATARWACDVDTDAKALARVGGSVQRYVQFGGRDTIRRNVIEDLAKPRWARVPTGATTCSWCRILASRGAVYLSKKSSGTEEGNTWHDGNCDCQGVPVWNGQQEPFDVGAYQSQYEEARKHARSGDINAIAAAMRELYGYS